MAHDAISRPEHYTAGTPESIDIIEAWGLGFREGNALKYILRAPYKGRYTADMRKALWYAERLCAKPTVASANMTTSELGHGDVARGWELDETRAHLVFLVWGRNWHALALRLREHLANLETGTEAADGITIAEIDALMFATSPSVRVLDQALANIKRKCADYLSTSREPSHRLAFVVTRFA